MGSQALLFVKLLIITSTGVNLKKKQNKTKKQESYPNITQFRNICFPPLFTLFTQYCPTECRPSKFLRLYDFSQWNDQREEGISFHLHGLQPVSSLPMLLMISIINVVIRSLIASLLDWKGHIFIWYSLPQHKFTFQLKIYLDKWSFLSVIWKSIRNVFTDILYISLERCILSLYRCSL